jgi:undecaprenyl-diphosphatase
MNYLYSILTGIVQGLTEFLPVSSSGHLVVLHDILKFDVFDNVLYDVVLHMGTLVALIVFFRRDIARLGRGFLASLRRWDVRNDLDQRLSWLVGLAVVPMVVAGAAFGDFIESTLRSPWVVAAALAAGACLFLLVERFTAPVKAMTSLTAADAAAVGLAQILSFIPGMSRSGITIVAGMGRRLERGAAARFSFLVSIPVFLGAVVKEALSVDWAAADWSILAFGFLAAAITGIWALRFFLGFVGRHSLDVFAWYRIGIALLLVAWLVFIR